MTKLVYVAGPYTAETEEGRLANVRRAVDAGIALATAGHLPLVPHLSHWFDLRAEETTGERFSWTFYLRLCLRLLAGCDGLLYLAPSKGADLEREEAERLGIPVYRGVAEIPPAEGGG